jgi:uncharacterized protein YukE
MKEGGKEMPRGRGERSYRQEFEQERQRLAQLWDAYEDQERELNRLKEELAEKERIVNRLMMVLEEHGIEDKGVHLAAGGNGPPESGDAARVQEMEEMLRLQNENWERLWKMAEEMKQELNATKEMMEQRDREVGELRRALGWD